MQDMLCRSIIVNSITRYTLYDHAISSQSNKCENKCVSRLARPIPHHTASSNSAAPNSECPPTVAPGAGG